MVGLPTNEWFIIGFASGCFLNFVFPFVKASAIFIKELLPNQLKVATIPLIVLVGDVVTDSTMLNHHVSPTFGGICWMILPAT